MRLNFTAFALSLCLGLATDLATAAETAVQRGAYLSKLSGCNDCHTPGSMTGARDVKRTLAGSDVGWLMPMGIFVGSNLTPDKETGLGTWSEADIVKAVTKGIRPDGRELAPIMPWRDFAAMTGADAKAIAAYLKSLPPIRNKVPGPLGPKDKPTFPVMTLVAPQR